MRTFPFQPKSTRDLEAGQFWGVRLDDGRFACGRVLQLGGDQLPTPRVSFFGGLLSWTGNEPPTYSAIAEAKIEDFGVMHLRTITRAGTGILGKRPLEVDGIALPALLSACGGPGCLLLSGAQAIRAAERNEWGTYPTLSFWGYDFIKQLAEHRLASG